MGVSGGDTLFMVYSNHLMNLPKEYEIFLLKDPRNNLRASIFPSFWTMAPVLDLPFGATWFILGDASGQALSAFIFSSVRTVRIELSGFVMRLDGK